MRRSFCWITRGLLGWAACTLMVGGCPVDPSVIDPESFAALPAAAGVYWVEHDQGELAFYRLPEQRGDPGTWLVVEAQPPEWLTGPAVYLLDDDGIWTRQTEGDLTLDEVIQIWDIGPAAESG